MKQIFFTAYTAQELKDQFPEAFKRAFEERNNSLYEIPWQDETIDSLKSLIKAAGLTLRDWSLGAYNRGNHIRLEDFGDAEELCGSRAFAWIENNLLHALRVPWMGKARWEVSKYGMQYRAGCVKPCPFTGYCGDDEYLGELIKSLRSGSTLKEAFEGLADTCAAMLERDDEYNRTEEAFSLEAEANDWHYTEGGEEI